jgi:hypothetical protein
MGNLLWNILLRNGKYRAQTSAGILYQIYIMTFYTSHDIRCKFPVIQIVFARLGDISEKIYYKNKDCLYHRAVK